MDQLQLELKTKAIIKAKIQAEYLTKPLGQSIGKAIYILDRNQQYNNYRKNTLDEVAMMSFNSENTNTKQPIDIEFEAIKIETTVTVKFQLK